jgi:heme exporter protein D
VPWVSAFGFGFQNFKNFFYDGGYEGFVGLTSIVAAAGILAAAAGGVIHRDFYVQFSDFDWHFLRCL